MPSDANAPSPADSQVVLRDTYIQSQAEDYGLSLEDWQGLLLRIAPIGPAAATGQKLDFYRSLRLEELALARGCAAGNDHAWEVFLTRFREKLYDAARHITKEDASAHELADSIYAELYGMHQDGDAGKRVSKLDSYSGRGSLEGWLRTVLAQEWVNRYRKQKRLVSLEEEEEAGAQFAAPPTTESVNETIKPLLVAATDASLAALGAEDRYILAAYYLDKRTLAQIAATLGVHESTISRKVEKLAQTVRKGILERLVKAGLSRRQAEEAMEIDVRDMALDVRTRLGHQVSGQSHTNPATAKITSPAVQESAKKPFSP